MWLLPIRRINNLRLFNSVSGSIPTRSYQQFPARLSAGSSHRSAPGCGPRRKFVLRSNRATEILVLYVKDGISVRSDLAAALYWAAARFRRASLTRLRRHDCRRVRQDSRREKSGSCSAGTGPPGIHSIAICSVRTPSEETNRFERKIRVQAPAADRIPANRLQPFEPRDAIERGGCDRLFLQFVRGGSKSAIEATGTCGGAAASWVGFTHRPDQE